MKRLFLFLFFPCILFAFPQQINAQTSWTLEHREYFKEKTAIFCQRLPQGKHTFYIDLLPRFSGKYTLNPAKIELMYLLVINANNDLRKLIIDGE
ncbi:MAG: hypothetical protein FWF72_03430 [Paludibacter sp.]|nr:hypothetical protein [Paludibacter sp.]